MQNLTLTNVKAIETITSMEAAQMINKEHRFLLRDIHRYINQINKINETKLGESKIALTDFFIESTYTTSQNKTQPCYNITHKGCEFIANKLTGIKGTEFTARYVNRFHELEENSTINVITTAMNTMSEAITTLTQSITQIQQDINNLKTSSHVKLPEKKYSRWKKVTFEKLRLLTEYVNEHSDQNFALKDTMHLVLNEIQDTYGIELSDYTGDYMMEQGLDTRPYDLDVVNYYKELRNMYDLTLNSILDKLDISSEMAISKNIFDELAEKHMCNDK